MFEAPADWSILVLYNNMGKGGMIKVTSEVQPYTQSDVTALAN